MSKFLNLIFQFDDLFLSFMQISFFISNNICILLYFSMSLSQLVGQSNAIQIQLINMLIENQLLIIRIFLPISLLRFQIISLIFKVLLQISDSFFKFLLFSWSVCYIFSELVYVLFEFTDGFFWYFVFGLGLLFEFGNFTLFECWGLGYSLWLIY